MTPAASPHARRLPDRLRVRPAALWCSLLLLTACRPGGPGSSPASTNPGEPPRASMPAPTPTRAVRESALPGRSAPESAVPGSAVARSAAPGRSAPESAASQSAPPMSAAPAADPVLRPFPGVVVHPRRSIVELEARVAINEGWLEQVACAPGTREHESLVVPRATPSQIHAALLMAGFIPGSPGRWEERDGELRCTPPTGSALDVRVRYADAAGETVEEPIRRWIVDHNGHEPFPDDPWIFAGSIVEPNPEWMGPGTHYVADLTGSIIGLVTFGDETIGFSRVLADQISVQPAEWEAATDRMPVPGTEVTIVLKKRE